MSQSVGIQDSDLADRRPGHVEITCHEPGQFEAWTAADVGDIVATLDAAAARVAENRMHPRRILDISMVAGFNHNPRGMLASPSLSGHVHLLGTVTYDWVHTLLQDGVFTSEVSVLLQACGQLEVGRREIEVFMADDEWRFPAFSAVKARNLHRVFSQFRISAADPDKIKCNCSELLGLYGMLRYFVETQVGPQVPIVRSDFPCTLNRGQRRRRFAINSGRAARDQTS